MKKLVCAVVLTACGCSGQTWSPVDPSTVNETIILQETERYSRLLNVRVVGHVTNEMYLVGTQYAAGWYVGTYGKSAVGEAYFYIPTIRQLQPAVSDGPEHVTNVAAHEVAHAVTGPNHDKRHWCVMASVARPTYPDPDPSTPCR